jgi:hypothetical protein
MSWSLAKHPLEINNATSDRVMRVDNHTIDQGKVDPACRDERRQSSFQIVGAKNVSSDCKSRLA